jgi:hypothetical protein
MLWRRFELLEKFSSVSRHAGNLHELEASVNRMKYEHGSLKKIRDRIFPDFLN